MPNYTPEAPERPKSPTWLSKPGRKIFADLVEGLIAANVPVKSVDKHSIAMAACCLDEIQRWNGMGEQAETDDMRIECAQIVARNQRDLQQWINAIGASPKSRAQMGLRGKQEVKKIGTVASILAAKRGTG